MHTFAAAGAGFLLAVLWFDLMFDVQTRRHRDDSLPPEVLASISAYYRRVTTESHPMNYAVAIVMALTLVSIVAEIAAGSNPWWISWVSLALSAVAFVPTLVRTVPNARRLGAGRDSAAELSTLARDIYRSHLMSLACMSTLLCLQFTAQ